MLSSATRRLSTTTRPMRAAASPALSRPMSSDADAARAPEASQSKRHSRPSAPRSFHSSTRDNASITALPAGADVDPDSVVPAYYIQFKRQRDAILERKELENELMSELSAGVLSDGIAATTRRYPHKIPTEHPAGAERVHASGFVVPRPGAAAPRADATRARDHQLQTSGVRARVREEDLAGINAQLRSRANKVPFEIREQDGTTRHASGFVPPTPAHDFAPRLGQDWATDPKRAFQ